MEQKKKRTHICASICDGLPTLFANHPWWAGISDQMLQNDHIVYTTRDPPSQNRYQIPFSCLGRRIRGCFHGWVVLSSHPYNDIWSLWNPVTSKIIRLPRLISDMGHRDCCLSSPPDDHGSIFMLTTTAKQTIVFCRLDRRRNKYKWVEMSYAKQIRSTARCDGFLHSLTCCNGQVYALNSYGSTTSSFVIHVNIAVKGKEIVISLSRYVNFPVSCYMDGCLYTFPFLKGCCTELFLVKLRVTHEVEKKTVGGVFVYKLDTKNMRWEEMEDLKDAAIFLNLYHRNSMFYSPAIGSELGNYLHLLDSCGEVIHSYDFKNKTVALSSMPMHHPSSLECRLQLEDIINNCNNTTTEEGNMESRLLSLPFDILKTIMELCVGVEYLNFRAVCKKCHLAAPMIRWSMGGRLQTYSLVSPWLMVLDKDRGVTSFTDPMFGDKYFIKTPPQLIGNVIRCSMYGWLLIHSLEGSLMFFNPFTSDIRELPDSPYLDTYYFSAPPTSSDCMVVGFKAWGEAYVHFVAREPSWRRFNLLNYSGVCSPSFNFATLYAQNLYALYHNEGIHFIDTDNGHYTWRKVFAKSPTSYGPYIQSFLMKCDQQLLQVIMGKFGGPVEVFKLNNDATEWEKIESLGRHAIYIGGKSCLCMEAKVPTMANKIYFSRVHSENRKIVFYSLETGRYHTSNNEESSLSLIGTTYHVYPHAWIEPSWS